jgi:hypothetical protein
VKHKGSICEKCNQEFHYVAFDFHHQDPSQKLFPLSQRHMSRVWDDLITEADKCHLLCANCHRVVHFEDDPQFLKTTKKDAE